MATDQGDFYQGFTAILEEDILPKDVQPTIGRIMTRSKVHGADEMSKGGIYYPKSVQREKQTTTGVIMALGEDVSGYALGDRLLYGKFAGVTLKFLADQDTHPEVKDYIYRLLYPEDVLSKIGRGAPVDEKECDTCDDNITD